MKLITPEQSEILEREIFKQALAIDALALTFAPPWGTRSQERVRRLYGERLKMYLDGAPAKGDKHVCGRV